jgi:hypothetical protein
MINREWHEAHRMPRNANLETRIEWHLEHAEHCGCRDVPESVKRHWKNAGRRYPHGERSRYLLPLPGGAK